ncbi:MAG: phage major capsid protein [Pseudomonadota bacterium]
MSFEAIVKSLETVERSIQSYRADQSEFADRLTYLEQKGALRQSEGDTKPRNSFGIALSQKLADNPALKEWKSDSGRRLANRVAIEFDLDLKAAIVNVGDTMAAYERTPGIVSLATRRRWIWEYMPSSQTSASGVEYLVESGSVLVAGQQASEGATKQESTPGFTLKRADCQTFAHWTQMSRQVFSDQPALAGFLQDRLMNGVWLKLEQQIINGNGTAPQLSGLLDSGNFVPYTGGDVAVSKVDHIRNAIAVLQQGDYSAGLVIVNPLDWKEMELERGDDGQYTWAEPSAMQPPTLWGLPVHVTNSVAAGTFIVLDPSATYLWTRQTATMLLSDSHEGTFIQNVLTALCEARFAFGVLRPEAIVAGLYVAA